MTTLDSNSQRERLRKVTNKTFQTSVTKFVKLLRVSQSLIKSVTATEIFLQKRVVKGFSLSLIMAFFFQAGSNNSRYFQENTASFFKRKLPFQVDGNIYEVSILNICLSNNKFLFSCESDREVHLTFNTEQHTFLIPLIKFSTN